MLSSIFLESGCERNTTIQQVPSAQSRLQQRADSQDHGPFRSIKRGWRIALLSTRVESVGCLSLVFFFIYSIITFLLFVLSTMMEF